MQFDPRERPLYEHRQMGWTTIAILVFVMIVLYVIQPVTPKRSDRDVLHVTLFLLLVAGALFSTMTVRVTSKYVRWWLGIPALGRRVALEEIESAIPIRTNLLEGWGIHLTWHGWLWNVSGFNAVQLKLRSGTRYALGTDEPTKLIDAIEAARKNLIRE
jgi:hypothetical protein